MPGFFNIKKKKKGICILKDNNNSNVNIYKGIWEETVLDVHYF